MINILLNLLTICGIVILSVIIISLCILGFYIVYCFLKKIEEELNKK